MLIAIGARVDTSSADDSLIIELVPPLIPPAFSSDFEGCASVDEEFREKRDEPASLSGPAPARSGRPIGRSVSWNLFALTNAL